MGLDPGRAVNGVFPLDLLPVAGVSVLGGVVVEPDGCPGLLLQHGEEAGEGRGYLVLGQAGSSCVDRVDEDDVGLEQQDAVDNHLPVEFAGQVEGLELVIEDEVGGVPLDDLLEELDALPDFFLGAFLLDVVTAVGLAYREG